MGETRRGVVLGVSDPNSVGAVCAARLREAGNAVVVTTRRGDLSADVLYMDADDEASVAAGFAAIGERWGRLDFLVHTWMAVPGGALDRPLTELSRSDFDATVGIGAWSLVLACRHARPLLRASGAARIVALGSACSERATPRYHVAGITKAALESTAIYLASELGPDGVTVNVVRFPLVATAGAIRVVGPEAAGQTRAWQAKKALSRRATGADEVANVVTFLCSEGSGGVTGQVLDVDGGLTRAYF